MSGPEEVQLEEAGGTSEPQQAQHEPTADGRSPGPPGGPLVVIGILVIVALIGLVAWMARGDDVLQTAGRADERFPDETTTTAGTVPAGGPSPATTDPGTVPPTEAPMTSAPPSTVAPGSSVPATPPALAGPSIAELVPFVAAFAEPLPTPDAVRAQIDLLLTAPRHDVASAGAVAALCAIVPLDGPIIVAGRWERDGRRVSSSDAAARDGPGFGECVGNDSDLLDDGSYQYIAVDADGVESAAGGFVVGAERIEQRFTNNGDEPICGIRIAPATSHYFEVYVFDVEPVAPGAVMTLPVAAVDQDVETMSCRKGEVLATFDFMPDPDEVQQLRP